MLEDYSFSIYYKDKEGESKTLDLACKEEREFDLWVIGIKALHSYFNNKVISKHDLLKHSKSYNEQIKKGNIGNCTKFLFYNNKDEDINKQAKNLESFLTNRELSAIALLRVLVRLCNRLGKVLAGPFKAETSQQAVNEDIRELKGGSLRWAYVDRTNVLRIVRVDFDAASDPKPDPKKEEGGLSGGAIAAIVIVTLVVVGAAGFLLYRRFVKGLEWADTIKLL